MLLKVFLSSDAGRADDFCLNDPVPIEFSLDGEMVEGSEAMPIESMPPPPPPPLVVVWPPAPFKLVDAVFVDAAVDDVDEVDEPGASDDGPLMEDDRPLSKLPLETDEELL